MDTQTDTDYDAVETISQAVVQAVEQILLRPNIFQEALRAAQTNDDKTFDKYVWEALRFNPINPLVFRLCEQDYTLASGTPRETKIPAKSIVFACTASAMFDATELVEPETFGRGQRNRKRRREEARPNNHSS